MKKVSLLPLLILLAIGVSAVAEDRKPAPKSGEIKSRRSERSEVYKGQGHGFFNHGRGGNYYNKTTLEMDKFLQSLGFLEGDATIKVDK